MMQVLLDLISPAPPSVEAGAVIPIMAHPSPAAYSWTHGSGEFASRTDMIWAPTAMQDCIQECNYFPSFFSDHQYFAIVCRITSTLQ